MKNIAYCGLNCEACCFRVAALEKDLAHLRSAPERYADLIPAAVDELELCAGCKSGEPSGSCFMQACASSKGYSTCAECQDMPCTALTEFCGDGVPHHGGVVENLKRIREIGEDAWAKEQEKAWKCKDCGKRLSWYRVECGECEK